MLAHAVLVTTRMPSFASREPAYLANRYPWPMKNKMLFVHIKAINERIKDTSLSHPQSECLKIQLEPLQYHHHAQHISLLLSLD